MRAHRGVGGAMRRWLAQVLRRVADRLSPPVMDEIEGGGATLAGMIGYEKAVQPDGSTVITPHLKSLEVIDVTRRDETPRSRHEAWVKTQSRLTAAERDAMHTKAAALPIDADAVAEGDAIAGEYLTNSCVHYVTYNGKHYKVRLGGELEIIDTRRDEDG